MLGSLLKVDGKIPFLQILIGIVIGVIAALVYVKLYKPPFFEYTEVAKTLPPSSTITSLTEEPAVIAKKTNTVHPEIVLVSIHDLPKVPSTFSSSLEELQESDNENDENEDM